MNNATSKVVKVSVRGGVLSVDRLPEGIEVELTEYDNLEIVEFVLNPKTGHVGEVLTERI